MQFLHETIKKTDFLTTVSGILNKKYVRTIKPEIQNYGRNP